MEGVAVTALSIDRVQGIISVIVIDAGGSSNLIKNFRVGEPCIFMGPSGKPTEIPQNENVLLVGGGRGNQPLTALAEVFVKNGCNVIFIAGYKKSEFIVRQERMENSCQHMVFAIEENPDLKLQNPQSLQIKGTVIDALKKLPLKNIDRIFTIGNDKMMHEIAKLRHENIVPALAQAKIAITSLNAPMQCMLKAVCSQCLQKRKNEKGEDEYFYACMEQDQNSDKLDFAHLHARCEQNSLLEKITKFA
jgi:NAD(P)H-flavin reductase